MTSLALPLVAGAAAAALYAHGFLRLRRRRPDRAPLAAAALFGAGVLVGLAALAPPLDDLADRLLTAHMAQHLLLGDVAPLLLVLGLAGPLALFVVPRTVLRAAARPGPRRALATLVRPRVALPLWAAVVYTWHVPALYDAAVTRPVLHALEHGTFAAAGLLVWTVILDPARRGTLGPGRRAAFAAGVLVAGIPLAEILIAAAPLYAHYDTVAGRPLGLGADEDQARAGLLMMAEQVATLGTAAALLLWRHAEALEGDPRLRDVRSDSVV